MQKKIIALAIAGLASTAAFAQSNVTVYGVMDLGYSYSSKSDTSSLKSRTGLDSGMQSGSRIGFKGVEDLGNGLKVSFVQENSVGADTGDGPSMTRQSLLALSGNFGTFAFGKQYTPQYGLVSSIDPFGAGTVGDVTYGKGVYFMGAAADRSAIRLQNLAAYVSPNFGGFNVIAGYTINGLDDEEMTAKGEKSGNAKVWAINPNYANGPLKVGFNYHQVTIDATEVDATALGLGPALAVESYKDKVWDLGASYDFGVAKLGFVYGQLKNHVDVSGNGLDTKTKQWMLGVTVPVGAAGAVLASYSQNKTDGDIMDNVKARKFALGYTHALSKRTNAYVAYAKMKTNDNAEGEFSVYKGNATLTTFSDADYLTGFNVGLRHQF